jgi:hypothetical protein
LPILYRPKIESNPIKLSMDDDSDSLPQIELEPRLFNNSLQRLDSVSSPGICVIISLVLACHLGYTIVLLRAPPSTQTVSKIYQNDPHLKTVVFRLALRNLSQNRVFRLELTITRQIHSLITHLSFNTTTVLFQNGSRSVSRTETVWSAPVSFGQSAVESSPIILVDESVDKLYESVSYAVCFLDNVRGIEQFSFSMISPNSPYIRFLGRFHRGIAIVCVYAGAALCVVAGQRVFTAGGVRHFCFLFLAFLGFSGLPSVFFSAAFFCLKLSLLAYLFGSWAVPGVFLAVHEAMNASKEWMAIVSRALYASVALFAITHRKDGARDPPATLWHAALLALSAILSLLTCTVYRFAIPPAQGEVVDRATQWVIGLALAFASVSGQGGWFERRKVWNL